MARNPGIPHYRRIADALAQRPAEAMQKMPSERALARRFKVARNTARRALEELRSRGVVTRLRGAGTFAGLRSERIVLGFGYLLDQPDFARLFEWLGYHLAEKGFQLLVRDTGLHGEAIKEASQLSKSCRAEAIFWFPSSHPLGLRAAMQARRKLPPKLPLLLVNDPLGLTLQGPHRFDLIYYDYGQAVRQLVPQLKAAGYRFPVYVKRSDVTLFSMDEVERGFRAALSDQGVTETQRHIVEWDINDKRSLRRVGPQPDAFILPYPCQAEFRESMRLAGNRLSEEAPLIAFEHSGEDWRFPIDVRDMAEVCAELLTNRVRRPGRINMRVAVTLPVLHRRRKPAIAQQALSEARRISAGP